MRLNRSIVVALVVLSGCQASGPQGLVKVPVAGVIPNTNAGAGLISNNAGSLTGVIKGPSAGLIANNAAGLIANNAAGLIANNAAGLISNNAGGYRLMLAGEALMPIPHAVVTARDELGEPLCASVRADAEGRYTLTGLKPSGPIVFVTASYSGGGVDAVLSSATAAPREGSVVVELDPATTLISKKLAESARAGAIGLTPAVPKLVADARQTLSDTMSETAAVAAVVFDDNQTAQVFDAMLDVSPVLKSKVSGALVDADMAGVMIKTEPRTVTTAPSPKPVAPMASIRPSAALELFDESFATGWNVDGTWNGEAGPSSDVTPYSGAVALSWKSGARGGFKFTSDKAVDTTGYKFLTFALRLGRTDLGLKLQVLDGTQALGHPVDLTTYATSTAEGWQRFDVPLTDLAAGDRAIAGFMLTESVGEDLPVSYLDRIGLER